MSVSERMLPEIIIAADWSLNERKRWMVRAELVEDGRYLVFPPEPVGETTSLVERVRACLRDDGTALIGFDFPIGLPRVYAQKAGLHTWRQALSVFGGSEWRLLYEISDHPSLRQPFYPLPKRPGQKGNYKTRLAEALGFAGLHELLRRCDRKTATRGKAECVFFTLGGQQVGAGARIGWRDVLAPATDKVHFWPFDGELEALMAKPGVVVAEIYPREAYTHLSVRIGSGTGRRKTSRDDRRAAFAHLLDSEDDPSFRLSGAAKSWARWGFLSDDDFDATVSLLSMLQIVTGKRQSPVPADDPVVRTIEGWILGQLEG